MYYSLTTPISPEDVKINFAYVAKQKSALLRALCLEWALGGMTRIGNFWVAFRLCFRKASPSAKPHM